MSTSYTPYPPKAHVIPKDDEEWHRFRREGFDPTHPIPVTFGGSDIGKIFLADRGKKKFQYFMHERAVKWLGSERKAKEYLDHLNKETSYSALLELYLEKASRLSGKDYFVKKAIDSNATRVGHKFEDYVAWCCMEDTRCKIDQQPGAYQHGHPDYDFIIANPDGLIESLSGSFKTIGGATVELDGVKCIWEGKTLDPVSRDVVKDWKKCLIPFKYEMQVRLYMSTLNIDYALISCAWGFQQSYSAHVLVVRDLEIEEYILKRIREFRDSILADDPPPLDGTLDQRLDILKRDIRRMSDKGSTAIMPASIYGPVAKKYLMLQKQRSGLKQRLDAIDEEMAEYEVDLMRGLGNAANGVIRTPSNTMRIKVSRFSVESVPRKKLEKEHPEIWKEFREVSPRMKFTVTEDRG